MKTFTHHKSKRSKKYDGLIHASVLTIFGLVITVVSCSIKAVDAAVLGGLLFVVGAIYVVLESLDLANGEKK